MSQLSLGVILQINADKQTSWITTVKKYFGKTQDNRHSVYSKHYSSRLNIWGNVIQPLSSVSDISAAALLNTPPNPTKLYSFSPLYSDPCYNICENLIQPLSSVSDISSSAFLNTPPPLH